MAPVANLYTFGMPRFIVYIHIESSIESDTENIVTKALQDRYFFRHIRPENFDRPILLPPWMYEGHSNSDKDTLARDLALSLRDATGKVLYVISLFAEQFGLWYVPGSLLGISHLDPDQGPK